jgi:hypothetical protein
LRRGGSKVDEQKNPLFWISIFSARDTGRDALPQTYFSDGDRVCREMNGVSFSRNICTKCTIFVHRIFLAFILGLKCQKTSHRGSKSFLFIALWRADLMPDDRKQGENEKKLSFGAPIRESSGVCRREFYGFFPDPLFMRDILEFSL